MSEVSYSKIDYVHPRTIWTICLQFFFTVIAMIPVYYYLREIVKLIADARLLLVFLPLGIAILLFLIQLRLGTYFWKSEKVFKKRDVLVIASKSTLLTIVLFYILFLFIFGYWLSGVDFYQGLDYQSDVGRLMAETTISLGIIYGIMVMMINVQESRFEQTLKGRFRR
ncbi:MAG: hypothetical protein ACXAD7_10910 [Candidatus Kariarchaeaceae archaeon]|jgi:hypothetical protein